LLSIISSETSTRDVFCIYREIFVNDS
jgi:hypothetical protein